MGASGDFEMKKWMDAANKDPQYQQLLSYYQEQEYNYRQIMENLPSEDTEIIEQYLTAGEAVYFRLAQLAFMCGKRSRKK